MPPICFDYSAQTPPTAVVSGTPFSWTHQASQGSFAIVVLYSGGSMTPAAAASVTFGGTAMTSLGSVLSDNTAAQSWLWVFSLANVAGGAETVSVTLTQTGDNFDGFATSFTYNGVSSVGTLQTAFGSSTTASVAVTSAPGDIVWGTVITDGANIPGFTGTVRENLGGGSAQPYFTAGDYPGASSVTVTAPLPVNFEWAAAGLNLIPIW